MKRLVRSNAHVEIQIEQLQCLSAVRNSWQDDGIDRQTIGQDTKKRLVSRRCQRLFRPLALIHGRSATALET
jgi:hypothetical protein